MRVGAVDLDDVLLVVPDRRVRYGARLARLPRPLPPRLATALGRRRVQRTLRDDLARRLLIRVRVRVRDRVRVRVRLGVRVRVRGEGVGFAWFFLSRAIFSPSP